MIMKRIKHRLVKEFPEISDIVQTRILCSLDGQISDVESGTIPVKYSPIIASGIQLP